MNQILYAEEPKKSKPIDKKKILIFFIIAIALFGLTIVIIATNNIMKNKSNEKTNKENEKNFEIPVPTIVLEQYGEEKAIIRVESEIAISHIIYSWNNESKETLEEMGKTIVEEEINIPVGENTLFVTVLDINGNETKEQKTYILEASKPIIELSKIGSSIKIKVSSKKDLAYVKYRWNSNEEIKEDMYTYEDKTIYEKTIEIPIGENTLKIEAEDISGIKNEKTQDVKAYPKAETQVVSENVYLVFTVKGEDKIKLVEFTINGSKFVMNTDTFGDTNEVYYKVKMENGWNYLSITSTTVNNAEKTTYWKYEYNSNEQIIN